MKRGFSLALATGVALAACGGTDKEGLFGSGGASAGGASGGDASGGTGGASTGGASGVGATGGFQSTGGASGVGATGGFQSTGGSGAVGGSSGSAGEDGGVTGGSAGLGGSSGNGGSAGVGGSSGVGGSGGSGAVPGLGSCFGHCGSQQPVDTGSGPDCFCDIQCAQFNDCCDDYKTACGPAGAGQVNCLTAGTCSLATSFCCNAWTGQSYSPSCAPKGQSCDPGVDFYCDGPEDCGGGTVCCGHFESTSGNSGFWTDLTCKPAGQCGQWPDVVICGSNPSVCGSGDCTQSGSQPQIRYCNP